MLSTCIIYVPVVYKYVYCNWWLIIMYIKIRSSTWLVAFFFFIEEWLSEVHAPLWDGCGRSSALDVKATLGADPFSGFAMLLLCILRTGLTLN